MRKTKTKTKTKTKRSLIIPTLITQPQYHVFKQLKRFNVLVTGRRWGKSDFAKELMCLWAANNSDSNIWFVASTYGQVKTIIWERLLYKTTRTPYKHLVRSINRQDLSITLHNNTIMTLKGSDNPQSLRGTGLILVILDEYAAMRPEIWEQIIFPMLSDRVGSVFFIGTPNGYDHLYEVHKQAFVPKNKSDWQTWIMPSITGGWISEEEINIARAILSEKVFNQEYMATFETFSGAIYYNFNHEFNVRQNLQDPTPLNKANAIHKSSTLLVGMDFNVNPMTAVIGSKYFPPFTPQQPHLYVHDDILIHDANTQTMAVALKKKWGWLPSTLELVNKGLLSERTPPDKYNITIYPDPSGNFRKSSATVGTTDHTILRDNGFTVIAPRKAPKKIDRFNSVNALLRNADNISRLFIHPRAKNLIETFTGLAYKLDTHDADTSTNLDHMGDAAGYLILAQFPLILRANQGGGVITQTRM